MWHAALLAAAVALLSDTGLGHVVHDPEQVALQRKLWELEGELWESEQDERQRIHRHHSHHRGPLLGLLRRRAMAASEPNAEGIASEPSAKGSPHGHSAASRKHMRKPGQLPSNHPAMRKLKVRQHKASDERVKLEEQVKDAMAHLNSVAVIKSKLAKQEVTIRYEEKKLKKLKYDHQRLDLTHRSLTQSLKRVMEPKIAFAEERLLKHEHEVEKSRARDGAWKQQEEKFHAASLAMIKERDDSKVNLETALRAEETARHLRREAEQQLSAAKRKTSVDIQTYRYAKTEARAAKNKEEHKEEVMQRSKSAVKRLSTIFHAEQGRVDESMAHGKDRVEGKIRELEEAKNKSEVQLGKLEHEYAEWQAGQESWKTQLASAKEGTNAASQNYADAQEAAFAAQRKEIVVAAEKHADWAWNDWPGMDDKVDDPQNPSDDKAKDDTPMAPAPASNAPRQTTNAVDSARKAQPQPEAADEARKAPPQPKAADETRNAPPQSKAVDEASNVKP